MFDYIMTIFCQYNFITFLSTFLTSVLVFMLELVDEFTKIVPSTFRPFQGHHQGAFANEMFVLFFFKF